MSEAGKKTMNQYCRYCNHCHYGDFCYCDVKKRTMSDKKAQRVNRCKDFEFNPLDVFCPYDEDGKPNYYKPQKHTKKERNEIIDNNLKALTEVMK